MVWDKLNLTWRFDFRLELIIATVPDAPQNISLFNGGQKWAKK